MRGFERGADDYICKPFSYAELRGCDGRAAAPRAPPAPGRAIRVGELEVDPRPHGHGCAASALALSQKEFALLRTLASEPARVFTKDELLRQSGASATRHHPHAGLPRLPAAQQARRRTATGSS